VIVFGPDQKNVATTEVRICRPERLGDVVTGFRQFSDHLVQPNTRARGSREPGRAWIVARGADRVTARRKQRGCEDSREESTPRHSAASRC
jgi:hypothetical protein